MTVKEILEQLKKINQDRLSSAYNDSFYDGFFSETASEIYSEVDALNTVIILLVYLNNKKTSDTVTVSEIFEAADIEA